MDMNIILKGPKMRNMNDYKNPDIMLVKIDNIDMYYNKISFQNQKKSGKLHVYHSYNGENYSGRYYDLDFDKNKLKIIKNTMKFKIDNYENEVDYTKKTVIVKITFSDIGIIKMQNFLSQF
jgi:hypothetical protein